MNKIRILQIGGEDLHKECHLPGYVLLDFLPKLESVPKKEYELLLLCHVPNSTEMAVLEEIAVPYRFYVLDDVPKEGEFLRLFRKKKGSICKRAELAHFLSEDARFFFSKPYGEKYSLNQLSISKDFNGEILWNGNVNVSLSGDFGEEFSQIAFFRGYVPIEEEQMLDYWPEYEKEGNVTIRLQIRKITMGTVDRIEKTWVFEEEQMADVLQLDNRGGRGLLSVSLLAKGKGTLKIRGLHDRYSRKNYGYFLPGGQRIALPNREEIFYYYDPGDLKPPLNVYFSGYRTQEGFEGYYMLKRMGAPFLLLTDPRLEGGSFYLGDRQYEETIVKIIKDTMDELDFLPSDVVMSGLSMGTFGALYYGCILRPHAVIMGKPLVSLGDIAKNEKLLRPHGFPTSLDVLLAQSGTADEAAAAKLSEKIWYKIENSHLGDTRFIVSYMLEDDYDADAYRQLISRISSIGGEVYGKGLHGRHNDNTQGILEWFLQRYYDVLETDFHRKAE